MGKKGSWFSAIKRVFTPHSKEKKLSESERKREREKKKGVGRLRHSDTNSFIPLFREPSSIEKILSDAQREQQKITFTPSSPPFQPKPPAFLLPRLPSPKPPSPRISSPRATSPRVPSPRLDSPAASRTVPYHRPEPTLRYRHVSATKIQAAYRGYMARRSFRALKGLVRLQGVVRGQNVKRQTMNAMKHMQLLVRVQSQIQSRRIQMLENQARGHVQDKNEGESTLNKWNMTQASEAGTEDWDDSLLTKEEVEARFQKKVDAVIKRERSMAYAYSHQLWKSSPKLRLTDIREEGFPRWWNWLERQLPPMNPPESQTIRNFTVTPTRPMSEQKTSPQSQSSNRKKQHFMFDNVGAMTPKSTKSTATMTPKQMRTPPSARIPPATSTKMPNYSRTRGSGAYSPYDLPLKDDDSLTSCPPFSVPNYMSPTVSAKAKARAGSSPKERFLSTPKESTRRISFPLTQGIGSFKWNKGSLFPNKDSSSQRAFDNASVDSTVSLPAGIGRKQFNRFV